VFLEPVSGPVCPPDAATLAEIEITREMVRADEEVLLCALGGAVTSHWKPDEPALSVFAAMTDAPPSSAKGGCHQQTVPAGLSNLDTI
jgi:hypothetical protein